MQDNWGFPYQRTSKSNKCNFFEPLIYVLHLIKGCWTWKQLSFVHDQLPFSHHISTLHVHYPPRCKHSSWHGIVLLSPHLELKNIWISPPPWWCVLLIQVPMEEPFGCIGLHVFPKPCKYIPHNLLINILLCMWWVYKCVIIYNIY
jgi:hypothetical protein